MLEDPLMAEKWLDALRREAARPGGTVAAAMLASQYRETVPLPPGGLDRDARDRARMLFGELREQGRVLLHRFDGASLARAREAVEGPLLVTEPAAPPKPVAVVLPEPAVTQRRGRVLGTVAIVLIVGGVFGKDPLNELLFPRHKGTEPELARAELTSPATP